eukprot:m.165299 g.165299  ORF g.165299 m.165299 type:complete len:111 (-) comp18133_c0_seq4:1108-1440(-)
MAHSNGYSDSSFLERLSALSSSQQSIQTLSLWLIHHRTHADNAADVWMKHLLQAPQKQLMPLMYLVSDAILQSRKRGNEIKDAFQDHLEEALAHVCRCVIGNPDRGAQPS